MAKKLVIKPFFTEVTIHHWQDFLSALEDKGLNTRAWIFRGQSDVNWPLETSFTRLMNRVNKVRDETAMSTAVRRNFIKRENYLWRQFKSRSHLYLNLNPSVILTKVEMAKYYPTICGIRSTDPVYSETVSKLEWLSIMQHHSAPTRMLDWTYSPYIAAFFALGELTEGAMYALKYSRIREVNKSLLKGELDIVTDKIQKSFLFGYEPIIKSDRISRQQGLFLVPSTLVEDFELILTSYKSTEPIGYRFVFTQDSIYHSISALKMMGITDESLFPGIDGFSKSLKNELLPSLKDLSLP